MHARSGFVAADRIAAEAAPRLASARRTTARPAADPSPASGSRRRTPVTSLGRAPLVLIVVAAAALASPGAAQAQRRTAELPDAVLAALRAGGNVVACRHGITDHDFRATRPHDFADASTQRTLTAAGEAQMSAIGEALRGYGLAFADVRASPYHRNVRSAELMFGRAQVDEALLGQSSDAERLALFAPPLAHGENRALVTHQSVLRRMVQTHDPIEEGDCLVIVPRAGTPVLRAHVAAAAWTTRAARP
jgi:phosphohistidine phosphatase SixA